MKSRIDRFGMCYGSLDGVSLLELARIASSLGLSTVTTSVTMFDQQVAAGTSPEDVKKALDDYGVRIPYIDPLIPQFPGLRPLADIDPQFRHLLTTTQQDCWRVAEALDAPAINMVHLFGDAAGNDQTDRITEVVTQVAETNYAQGFDSFVEFIAITGIPDLATAVTVTSGSEHVKILFDTWHFARSGGRVSDIALVPPRSFGSIQLNDWRPPAPDAVYVPMSRGRRSLGDGVLPLVEIMDALDANSPGLDILIEVFSDDLDTLGWEDAAERMTSDARAVLA